MLFRSPLDPVTACAWFIDEIGRRLEVRLPAASEWVHRRVDWAEAYDLGSYEAVEEFFAGLNLARFPRRRANRYGDMGFQAPGDTTTLKLYGKGEEFGKHDFRRLRHLDGGRVATNLQHQANAILRVEVEVHSRKLDSDFGGNPSIVRVTRQYLEGVHDIEVGRLLREGGPDMEIVRTHREVNARLHDEYGGRLANILFGVWLQLSTVGEKVVRQQTARRTFYRQRAQLEAVGVSWEGADVHIDPRPRLLPVDFTPQQIGRAHV